MLRIAISVLLAAGAVVVAVPTSGPADVVRAPEIPAGEVTVVGESIMAPTAFQLAAAAVAGPGCTDAAHALAPWRLPSTFGWYYNGKGAPASVASTALTALRDGTRTLFQAGSRCGGTTTLATTERYLGASTRTAQVSSTGVCTGNDNVSVTSWGALPSSTLAHTCVYYRTGTKQVIASDMLIDNKLHKWFTKLPARCSNTFDLQTVVVHERGHTAGLAHVDQASHASQVMSPKVAPCTTAERLLGAGDAKGLKVKYPR